MTTEDKARAVRGVIAAFGQEVAARLVSTLDRPDRDMLERQLDPEAMRRELTRQGVELQQWLDQLPTESRALALEFPPGTRIEFLDAVVYVIGYRPDGAYIRVSETSPADDYDLAMRTARMLGVESLRSAMERKVH